MSQAKSQLDERVYVARSPIHGRGLFAKRRIRSGSYIGTYEGKPTQRDGTYVLWLYDADGSAVGQRGTNALRFLNHSDAPNAELHELDLYALRAISPDEEITIDYQWD